MKQDLNMKKWSWCVSFVPGRPLWGKKCKTSVFEGWQSTTQQSRTVSITWRTGSQIQRENKTSCKKLLSQGKSLLTVWESNFQIYFKSGITHSRVAKKWEYCPLLWLGLYTIKGWYRAIVHGFVFSWLIWLHWPEDAFSVFYCRR